jgi:hypothetical protein
VPVVNWIVEESPGLGESMADASRSTRFLIEMFYGTAGVFLYGAVLVAGLLVGVVCVAGVAVTFGFSHRIPRLSCWLASALVVAWLAVVVNLAVFLRNGLTDIASSSVGGP